MPQSIPTNGGLVAVIRQHFQHHQNICYDIRDEIKFLCLLFYRAAICCLGSMYEKLGRMMGRSYEETVTTLVRSLKSAESQTRLEIMITLEKVKILAL